MLLVPSPCTGRTSANLLTVSSRSHAPSGYGAYFISFFFPREINAHLSLLLYCYTLLLNINYTALTGVDAVMNRGK